MTSTGPAPVPAPPPGAPAPHQGGVGRALLVAGVVVGLLAVAWAALFLVDRAVAGTSTQHETYDAVGTVELVADGDVTVRAVDGGEVEVDRIARTGLTSPAYRADEGADRLVVTHECRSWIWVPGRCGGELAVTLPADTRLVVRTSNGDVTAADVVGGVELRSSNGDVQASGTGPLDADTSNGDLIVDRASADVVARTSNGDIQVSGVEGSLDADSSNGRVEVSGVTGDVRAESTNGDVTVVGDDRPVRLTIETSHGEQTNEGAIDAGADRTVEIRSSNGDVAYLVR